MVEAVLLVHRLRARIRRAHFKRHDLLIGVAAPFQSPRSAAARRPHAAGIPRAPRRHNVRFVHHQPHPDEAQSGTHSRRRRSVAADRALAPRPRFPRQAESPGAELVARLRQHEIPRDLVREFALVRRLRPLEGNDSRSMSSTCAISASTIGRSRVFIIVYMAQSVYRGAVKRRGNAR